MKLGKKTEEYMHNELLYNKFKISLKALRDCELPNYHGSMLRGVMGRTIMEVSCTKENEKCEICDENDVCPYTKIFYGINSNRDTILGKYCMDEFRKIFRQNKQSCKHRGNDR